MTTDDEQVQIILSIDELAELVGFLRLTANIPVLDVPTVVANLLEMTERVE